MTMNAKRVALITGASTGLGAEFARLFARDGYDLVLVARSLGRLETLAQELAVFQVKAHVIAEDLAKPGAAGRVWERVQGLGVQIECLVNNAGFGSTGALLDLPASSQVEMIELNCVTLLELTHAFGRPMRERGHGRILNIASTAGFQPGPYMATYYATKAFVLSLTEALAHELKRHGVSVTCHCPGATATEFASRAGNDKSKLFQRPGVAKADAVAAHAYKALMQGKVLSIHGILNWLAVQALRVSPRAIVRRIAAALNQA
ncbi:MAG: SDR family oxidoreductase [Myxococcales bacterium]|nr:SDR family oxidoreductase [Myxococcales bacterium]